MYASSLSGGSSVCASSRRTALSVGQTALNSSRVVFFAMVYCVVTAVAGLELSTELALAGAQVVTFAATKVCRHENGGFCRVPWMETREQVVFREGVEAVVAWSVVPTSQTPQLNKVK